MDNHREIKSPRGVALAVATVALLLAVWVGPGLASAHAELISSTPAAGSTVKPGLTQIVLNFGEETSVDQSLGELDGPNGAAVSGASMAVDRTQRTKMVITTSALTAGTYTVKWKSVTEDDNGIETGTFTFTVADNAPETVATPVTTDTGGQGGTTSGSLPVSGVPGSPAVPVALTLLALGLLTSGVMMVRRALRRV